MSAQIKGDTAPLDPVVTARYEGQMRKLTNALNRFRHAAMWETMNDWDLRSITGDIASLRTVLPKRRRVFGDWQKASAMRKDIDIGASMASAAVSSGHFALIDPEVAERLAVAVDGAAAALAERTQDDSLIEKIEKLGRTEGRTEHEIRTAVEAVERLTDRRRFT